MLTKNISQMMRLLPLFALAAPVLGQAPLGSEWTYQGRLTQNGAPLNGTVDLQFRLWDADTNGNTVGPIESVQDLPVVDGLITVELDFGQVFTGDTLWLVVGVRDGADCCGDPYTILNPRQPLTAAPYAQTAVSALSAEAVPGIDGHSLDAADGAPTDALFVDSTGDVGIGTTTPAHDLHVSSATGTPVKIESSSTSATRLQISNTDQTGQAFDIGVTGSTAGVGPGNLLIRDLNAGNAARLMIDQTGNVGIGTTAPEYTLDVSGAIRASNNAIKVTDGANNNRVVLNRNAGNDVGTVETSGPASANVTLGFIAGNPDRGFVGVKDENGTTGTALFATANGGEIDVRDPAGQDRATVFVQGDGGGRVRTYGANGNFNVTLGLGVDADHGGVNTYDNAGTSTAAMFSALNGGVVEARNPSGSDRAIMSANAVDCGDIQLLGPNGNVNVWMTNLAGSPDHGWLGVFDSNGTAQVGMYVESDGDGRMFTGVLQVNGGSDLAEPFDVSSEQAIEPGMVVAIDPERTGKLRLSTKAYDRTVAGIISGAGGVTPGLMMSQRGSVADGEHPVALTGRVYCWVDADAGGPVQPGDLLTTADTPGHAMRVTDHSRAGGAILGKAMSCLESGRGLVLVLVSLQ